MKNGCPHHPKRFNLGCRVCRLTIGKTQAGISPTLAKAMNAVPKATRLPCRFELDIIERCPSCGIKGELNHVRECDIHDRCTRGPNNGAVASCATCKDYQTPAGIWENGILRYHHTTLYPGLPGKRFNPGLIEWPGEGSKYAFCWRDGWAGSNLWICRLDAEFTPVGDAVRLTMFDPASPPEPDKPIKPHPDANYGREDPTLFIHRGALHVSFVGVQGGRGKQGIKTNMIYARLAADFSVEDIFNPKAPGVGSGQWQKNWQFFEHDETLYAIYSSSPHRILKINGNDAEWAHTNPGKLPWSGGEVRGGATPVRVGDEFYAFFHDSVGIRGRKTYRFGCYVFEAKPPFRITRSTSLPLAVADRSTQPAGDANYADVLFPRGAVRDGADWVISCGVHDRFTELRRVPVAYVEECLRPVGGSPVSLPVIKDAPRLPPPALPPTYAIYCEELIDRRRATESHLAERGVIAHWWQSIHGATWGLKNERNEPNHAGLSLGHWSLWQHLWQSGAKEALIFEDDVVIPPDFAHKFAAMRKTLPENWQFVFVGVCESGQAFDVKITERPATGLVRMSDPFGTHCYLVRRSALPVLLNAIKGTHNIDTEIYERVLKPKFLEWYVCNPSLAGQRTFAGEWEPSTRVLA